jgi:hypothetical protein
MKITAMILLIFLILACKRAQASDWPQYLGPGRNSVSDERGLLRRWPEGGQRYYGQFPLVRDLEGLP